jgi:hypothetical protein
VSVHELPSHSQTLNGGKISFYEKDMIEHTTFNFKIINYKTLLNFLNLPLEFSTNVLTLNFTSK